MLLKISFYILSFFLLTSNLYSQNYSVFKISKNNNEITDLIKSVEMDSTGVLWLATDEGLVKFTGDDSKIYLDQLPSKYVKDVFLTSKGELLISTDLGIMKVDYSGVDPKFETLIPGSSKTTKDSIYYPKLIFEDSKANVWIPDNYTIFRYNKNGIKRYHLHIKNSTNSFLRSTSIFEYHNNVFALSEAGYLHKLDQKKDAFIETDNSLSDRRIRYVSKSKRGLLIATDRGLLHSKINTKGKLYNKTNLLPDEDIAYIAKIKDDFLLGSSHRGLSYMRLFDNDSVSIYNYKEYARDNVNDILISSNNKKVFIASDNGVSLIEAHYFRTILGNDINSRFLEIDSENNKYFLADLHNIYKLETSEINIIPQLIYSSNSIINYIKRLKNNLYVAQNNNELGILDSTNNYSFIKKFNTTILGIETSEALNKIYILLDNGELFSSDIDNHYSFAKITSINIGELCNFIKKIKDKLYVGTVGGDVLHKIDLNTFEHDKFGFESNFETNMSIVANDVVMKNDTLLVASNFGLIYKNAKNIWKKYKLFENTNKEVKSITIDSNNIIWISNSDGAFRLNKGKTSSFDETAGMPSKIVNYRAMHTDKKNRIWIGTVNGPIVNNPAEIGIKTKAPTIKSIFVNGIEHNKSKDLVYKNNIKFNFIAYNYPLSEQIYQFRLSKEGEIIEDWNYYSGKDYYKIENISDGEYLLESRSRQIGNYFESDISSYAFSVFIPWYETWWGILILLFIAITSIYGGQKYRSIQIIKENNRLSNLVENKTEEIRNKNKNLKLIAKEAQSANEAKNFFLSNMSHELRTPLNGVIGISNILLQENPRKNQINMLETLKFSARNLLMIVNDILDFNKIEAGKLNLEEVNFDIEKLLENIRQTFTHQAREKGISFNIEFDNKISKNLRGDPTRINQILFNTIGNAIKFTSSGSVTLRCILASNTEYTNNIKFEIEDTGIGIKEDLIGQIFHRFQQASNNTTRKFGGTGLGLSISKSLVEQMNSKLLVKSEYKKGTTFYFEIELKKGINKNIRSEKENKWESLKSIKNNNVLVVDDNEINLLVAKNFLSNWNFNVTIVNNGNLAIDIISKNEKEIDIILMDLQMPIIDGYETTAKIRQTKKGKNLPILAVSADVLNNVKEKIKEKGLNDFVSKPFEPDDLLGKLDEYLNHEK